MTTDLDAPLPAQPTVFTNANLVGREGRFTVVVHDGLVAAVVAQGGSVNLPFGAQQIDATGLWLSPGLIDWHTHFTMNTLASRRVDLYDTTSVAEVLSRIKAAIHDPAHDEGGRLVCINLRFGDWPDRANLTRAALDSISTTKPIFIIFSGYHSGLLNTPALAVGGYTPQTLPTGTLEEQPAFSLWVALQRMADATVLDGWVEAEAQRAAALGVTEVVDLEMDCSLPVWQRRVAGGFSRLRVHMGLYAPHLDEAIELGLRTGDAVPGTHGLVRVGPHKIMTDGSLGSQTAYCCDPYPKSDNRGLCIHTAEELGDQMAKATTNGFQLAVHAIGDEAMRLTLGTFASEANHGRPALPGSRIEHAQLLQQDDIATFARLGLVASVQPRHMVDDRELCAAFWPGREGRTFPFRWFVDAEIPMKFGSDCPVAPLQPWEAMAVAVSRAGVSEDAFCPEHLIDIKTAYAASTHTGKLTVAVGDAADIVLLSYDPLILDAQGLRAMSSQGTMLGGRWTHPLQQKPTLPA